MSADAAAVVAMDALGLGGVVTVTAEALELPLPEASMSADMAEVSAVEPATESDKDLDLPERPSGRGGAGDAIEPPPTSRKMPSQLSTGEVVFALFSRSSVSQILKPVWSAGDGVSR